MTWLLDTSAPTLDTGSATLDGAVKALKTVVKDVTMSVVAQKQSTVNIVLAKQTQVGRTTEWLMIL